MVLTTQGLPHGDPPHRAGPAAEGENLDMAAVTKRLILRSSAPAEGDAVADLVRFTVSGFDRDASSHPERPVLTPWRVFNNDNGLIEFGLNRLPAFVIRNHQPTRGAVACFY